MPQVNSRLVNHLGNIPTVNLVDENKIIPFRKKHPAAPAESGLTRWCEVVEDAKLKHSMGMKSALGTHRLRGVKSAPTKMLEFLMEQKNVKAADLPLPASRVSEIVSGKRRISKSQARELGKFFHVSPFLFYGL